MDIQPLRSRADYEPALRRVEELWDSAEGSTEGDEVDILTTLIEAYEREHYPPSEPAAGLAHFSTGPSATEAAEKQFSQAEVCSSAPSGTWEKRSETSSPLRP